MSCNIILFDYCFSDTELAVILVVILIQEKERWELIIMVNVLFRINVIITITKVSSSTENP